MFLQWDNDQDGYISRKELRENIKNATDIFKVKEPNFLAILNAMDSDGDGYIDFTEFITAALDKHKLLAAPMINKAFKLLDYDQDGKISVEDLKRAFQAASEQTQ